MTINPRLIASKQADLFETFLLKLGEQHLDAALGEQSPTQLRNLALNLTQFAAYLEDYWAKRSECSFCHKKLSTKLMDYSSDLCLDCWNELHNP